MQRNVPVTVKQVVTDTIQNGIVLNRTKAELYAFKDWCKIVTLNAASLVFIACFVLFFAIWYPVMNEPKLTMISRNIAQAEYHADYEILCMHGNEVKMSQVLSCTQLFDAVNNTARQVAANTGFDVTQVEFVQGVKPFLDMVLSTCLSYRFSPVTLQRLDSFGNDVQRAFLSSFQSAAAGSAIAMQWQLLVERYWETKMPLYNSNDTVVNTLMQTEQATFFRNARIMRDNFVVQLWPQLMQHSAGLIETLANSSYSAYYAQFKPRLCQQYKSEDAVKVILNIFNSSMTVKTIIFVIAGTILSWIASTHVETLNNNSNNQQDAKLDL